MRKVLNSDANYRLGWFFRNEKKCVKRFRLWALFAIATCGLISEMHFLEIGFHNVVNHKNSKSKFVTLQCFQLYTKLISFQISSNFQKINIVEYTEHTITNKEDSFV